MGEICTDDLKVGNFFDVEKWVPRGAVGARAFIPVLTLHLRTFITSDGISITSDRISIASDGTTITSQFLKKCVIMNPWETFYWL